METASKKPKNMPYRMLINGELLEGDNDQTFDVINPSTATVFAQAPHASMPQTEYAIKTSREAQVHWAILSLDKRKAYMERAIDAMTAAKDDLANLLVREQGKPLASAQGEVNLCLNCMRYAASIELPVDQKTVDFVPASENHQIEIHRCPIGVVAGITPWNFPMFCSVQKWAPAIMLGNTFILKPSPFTPLTALHYARVLQNVFPPGVLNIITGDDKAEFNVGSHISSHPDVRKVTFTGSCPTGKKNHAGRVAGCEASDSRDGGQRCGHRACGR